MADWLGKSKENSVILIRFSSLVDVVFGIALSLLAAFAIITVMSAAQTIFVSAVYHNFNDTPVKHFNKHLLDNLFEKK